jgi:hypothetical protein
MVLHGFCQRALWSRCRRKGTHYAHSEVWRSRPKADVPFTLANVCFRMQSSLKILAVSISGFDPTATFGPALHLFPSVASIDYSVPLLEGLQPRG